MSRISSERMFMEIAQIVARRSTCSRRAAVGVVFADKNNRVVSTGYNGSPERFAHCDDVGCILDQDGHCVSAVHAEMNAIIQCARTGVSTENLLVFCTHSPCPRCAISLIQAKVSAVIYGVEYRDIELTKRFLEEACIPLIVYGGQ